MRSAQIKVIGMEVPGILHAVAGIERNVLTSNANDASHLTISTEFS